MSEEQKLSRFILGLEGSLAAEVESLHPVSLADALIRAQSKLNSLQYGMTDEGRKRNFPPPTPYRPPKAPYVPPPVVPRPPAPHPPTTVTAQVRALPVNQSGRPIQCYGCQEWGHKKRDCPKGRTPGCPALPPQRNAFLNRNQGGPNRQNPRNQPATAKVNHVTITEETEEQAHIYAALDPKGYNRQYSILEVPGEHEGKSISFLIDSGSFHTPSFHPVP